MRTFSFRKDAQIQIEGKTYRLVNKYKNSQGDIWQLERLSDHFLENRALSELLNLYSDGKLILDTDENNETILEKAVRRKRQTMILSELSDKDKELIKIKRRIVREVDERIAIGMRTIKPQGSERTYLEIALAEISTEMSLKKAISSATYYRWAADLKKHNDTKDLIPSCSERGNRSQLDPDVKHWMLDALGELLIGRLGRSITTARAMVKARIEEARRADPARKLVLPSTKTFYQYWCQTPAFERAAAKYGPTRARHMFRSSRGHQKPEACLDLVEFDETRLPFYVIDETYNVPLGAPWLAWCLDVYSQVPCGFYLGFEPPGDVAVAATLRHAILPKSYVQRLYPDIRTPWPAMGRPRMLLIDNGLSQHGRTLEQIAFDLDFDFKFTPVRTPWFKSVVERSFGILNQLLLKDLPGYRPPPGTVLEAYNPSKQGLISFSTLLFIIHKWICDEYLLKPHSELHERPIDWWIAGTRSCPPELIGDANDLDAIFGIIRDGTLDHRGVVFEGLRYHSDDLERLLWRHGQLRMHGARMDVRVKVNHSDLGSVRVFDADQQVWIKVLALRQDYACGLTLHRHLLYVKHARERDGSYDPDAWLLAHHEIQEFIKGALPVNLGVGVNKLIARALGIGTHNLFNDLNLQGNFSSEDLAPATEPAKAPSFAPPTAPAEMPPDSLLDAGPAKPPQGVHRVPKFATDNSLRRS